MSAESAARSFVSIILLLIGLVFLVVAALDFFGGFGLVYSLILVVIGVIFLAISGSV
ncbi:MAG: hypothetical protein L3K02_00250 [Thermoplasmata archaeon]|nr:hypothetical protein [Thermoplasmata archaeon]